MDFKEIKELIRVFDKSELNRLKVKQGDFEISMQSGFENTQVQSHSPVVAPTPQVAINVEKKEELPNEFVSIANKTGETINSPMVGTFYSSPSPESPEFVKVGDKVKKGQTLCILEAMKIMNEVEAEFDCIIKEILIQNGSPVEYDMPIFVIEKL